MNADSPRRVILLLLNVSFHIIATPLAIALFPILYLIWGWKDTRHTCICKFILGTNDKYIGSDWWQCPRCKLEWTDYGL